MFLKMVAKIVGSCVDCHMPMQQSKAIVSDLNGKRIAAQVRTHWIKVYPAEAGVSLREESGAAQVNVR
jgi:hypothetical protein